jgi:hypothetical protein
LGAPGALKRGNQLLVEVEANEDLALAALIGHRPIKHQSQPPSRNFPLTKVQNSIKHLNKMIRGAVSKETSAYVGAWFPAPLQQALDLAVRSQDTDRSKFIRSAVRERLERDGLIDQQKSK